MKFKTKDGYAIDKNDTLYMIYQAKVPSFEPWLQKCLVTSIHSDKCIIDELYKSNQYNRIQCSTLLYKNLDNALREYRKALSKHIKYLQMRLKKKPSIQEP